MESLYCYLVLTILFIFFAIKLVFTRNRNLPPAPPFTLPIIGHLHLIKEPLHLALESLLSQHGPILYLQFGSRPVLVLSSPSAVEECFTKNDITFANRPRSMAGDHFTYNYTSYVWAPYGQRWRSLRRFTVVELFSSNAIHKSSSALQTEIRYHLLRRVFRNSTCDGKVDLKNLFSLLMINFTMRMVAGRPGTEDEAAESEIEKKFLAEFKEIFYPSLSMNVCDFFPILRLIGFKGIEKKFVMLQKLRDEYLEKVIDGIRSKKNTCGMDGGEKKIMSLVENLLYLQQSEPQFYTDNVIKSMIMIMFVAGVETTSITLEWAMSLLLNHPEAMQKVKAEIDSHVGQGCLLDESDLVKLPYLRCVINETLRLYPVAPLLLPHYSSEDCIVGGYNIPRGTMLVVNAWAMHRDPKVWEEPTKFKPERFEENLSDREGFKYIPFGMGRRTCPGAAMAIRTVSLALGSLVQCFEWEKIGQEVDMSQTFGLSLSKSKPLVAVCSPCQSMVELLSQL
ncbi:hypothetical protein Ddye_006728 [Dipteronia dyeriana]|uniref:Cytochrome P450 n=1 Tax=Dipteronia dyeriana TaxID=168575 RepID=A0AAD9XIM7_9ROSI|nr:hypothetical protein Ddye_006728 [Dipteronia dyeriana]